MLPPRSRGHVGQERLQQAPSIGWIVDAEKEVGADVRGRALAKDDALDIARVERDR
jgi:hypothetical protein